MNRLLTVLIIIGASLGCAGCAHNHLVGENKKSETSREYSVGIGSEEVKEGDTVVVTKSVCKNIFRPKTGDIDQCHYKKVGEALVLKILAKDSSIVAPVGEFIMDTSMRVEKQ